MPEGKLKLPENDPNLLDIIFLKLTIIINQLQKIRPHIHLNSITVLLNIYHQHVLLTNQIRIFYLTTLLLVQLYLLKQLQLTHQHMRNQKVFKTLLAIVRLTKQTRR